MQEPGSYDSVRSAETVEKCHATSGENLHHQR